MRGEMEFKEARFVTEHEALRSAPASIVVRRVLGAVQQFSGGTQSDDLTLLVLRGTHPGTPSTRPLSNDNKPVWRSASSRTGQHARLKPGKANALPYE